MSGGGGQTTVQNNQPPPQFLAAYQNVMNQAQGVAGTPFQTPQAPVAPLNGYQGVAAQNTFNAQGAAQPYIDQAGQLLNQSQTPIAPAYQPFATGALDSAYAGAATPILSTGQPFMNQATAGYAAGASTPLEAGYQPFANQATQGYLAGQSADILGQAAGLSNPAAGIYAGTAGGISPQQVQQYESPYTQQVVQATQNQFNNANEQQQQGVIGNAVSSGAWGGDRSAVAQGITAGQEQLAQAPVIAGLENQGYAQALQTAEQQQQTQQQAAAGLTGIAGLQTSALEQAAQNQFAGAQGIAAVGAEQGALGEQQAQNQFTAAAGNAAIGGQEMSAAEQQAQNQFNYAGIQNQVGQQFMGAQEAQNWLASQGSYGAANLGNEALNTQLTGANALMGAGNVLQSQQQAEMNAPYEQQLAAEAYPFQETQWLANIAEGTGSAAGGTSSTTAPGPSAISQIGGLATTGLGIAALAGMLRDGGRVQHRAGGGGIAGAAMIPGMPGPSAGSGIHGVVDIIPDTSAMQPGHGGSGPPRPPATTPTSSTQTSAANEATGMMNAIKLGDQANAGVKKIAGTGEGLYSAATFAPDAAATEAAANAGAAGIASGAGEGLGLLAAAKRGGAIPTFGAGGMINAPRAPRLQHMPNMGIAGSHAFHPPGLPKLAPGGGISVDPYPNQTAAEVQNLTAAQDQSNAMAMAMASLGTSMPMAGMGMMARGGGIAGFADGGSVGESDSDSFDTPSGSPVTITGAGDSNAMPTPPIPPAGGPPPAGGGIAGDSVSTPAAQVTMSPDAGPEPSKHGGIMDNKEIWTSVLAAGLGMMGGSSPFAGVNIGRGGLEGLSMYNQLRNRDENVALRQQQQESNNLYRQGLLADKGQGRDIQRDRAATYSQMQQDHASLMQAQAALAMARAANVGATKMNDAELKASVMNSLVGQPKDPNDPNSPKMTRADAYRSVSGLDIRQEVADTGAKRADTAANLGQQRLALAQGYNTWRMQHGNDQLNETENFHGYLKNNGMTNEGIRVFEGSKNPITGEYGMTMKQAQDLAAQGRAANQPAGGQPMSQTQAAPADPLGIR